MNRSPFLVMAVVARLVAGASPAFASLAPSEREQVRHDVLTAQNSSRVRALVARPDLTSSEAAAAMSDAMATTSLDEAHVSYLRDLVFGTASAASRPVLAVAVVRAVLSRVDALLALHPLDLDRSPSVLGEMSRSYGVVEEVVAADESANVTGTARADCALALQEHVARNPAILRPDASAAAVVAVVRAQAAIALLDALPTTPAMRLDAANALGLEGPRRATLVEAGVLVLDSGGASSTAPSIRPLLDRLPGARGRVEAIVVGDEHAPLRGRGRVIALPPPAAARDQDSPWAEDTAGPAIDATTMAAAGALAGLAVARAVEVRPQLGIEMERNGGQAKVAKVAAMLVLDAPRTLDVAVANWQVGKRETAEWVADALGALAVFAPPTGSAARGLAFALGGSAGGKDAALATQVSLDATGAASAFHLGAHAWRIARASDGTIESVRRDGRPLDRIAPANAHAALSTGPSWRGAGLIFARLAGSPRAAVAPGPRILLVGSGATDAIAAPAPGDDVVVDADLRVEGAPAGIAARVIPTADGFKGISLVIYPGSTARAALLVADGTGVEAAVGPPLSLASSVAQHVRLAVKGRSVDATVGGAKLSATLSSDFAHGDVALRAYAGATLEATGWRVAKP